MKKTIVFLLSFLFTTTVLGSGWSGSGSFTRVHDWTDDAAAAIPITASRMDAEDDNFASGIQACLAKNGENAATANMSFGGYRLTGVGAGSAATDAATIGGTETLTNKTLTSPTISGPTLSGTATGTYTLGGTPTINLGSITSSGDLPVAQGGTGASTEADARTNLGLVIGTDVLAVPGAWTTPTFDAGDFTASGSMTWTVASGDVGTYAYTKAGKVLTVSFFIDASTVGGTPSTELRIAIPGGFTATKAMANPVFIADNGTQSIGVARTAASGTTIVIVKADSSNFTASTNNTTVRGQITIEVN